MNWFKTFLPAFLLLLLAAPFAAADVFLVSPFEKQIAANDTIELGSAAPGETVELIFSTKSGKDFAWSKAEIARQLPDKWIVSDSAPFAETLIVKITVPVDEQETAQNIKIILLNFNDEKKNESFNALLFVKKNLIKASVFALQKETKVGEPVEFEMQLSNDSIADHVVNISSTLPKFWFEDKRITLKKKTSVDSIQEIKLGVLPRSYGTRDFSFIVNSATNGKQLDKFDARLTVNPTLKGKYAVALYGFPVFTPTLFPYYLVNSFLSFLR